jgi:hypothetical protein
MGPVLVADEDGDENEDEDRERVGETVWTDVARADCAQGMFNVVTWNEADGNPAVLYWMVGTLRLWR